MKPATKPSRNHRVHNLPARPAKIHFDTQFAIIYLERSPDIQSKVVEGYRDADHFLFINSSPEPPLVGYLMPDKCIDKIVPAVRVEIDGTWSDNPHYLKTGSMSVTFGHLRAASISDWPSKFPLDQSWILKPWTKMHDTLIFLSPKEIADLASSEYDFHSIESAERFLSPPVMRYLAILCLWPYWEDRETLYAERPDDLKALGIGKRAGGRTIGGGQIGGKVSKGTFANLASRAGIPKQIAPSRSH